MTPDELSPDQLAGLTAQAKQDPRYQFSQPPQAPQAFDANAQPPAEDFAGRPTEEDLPQLMHGSRVAAQLWEQGDMEGYNNAINRLAHLRPPNPELPKELTFPNPDTGEASTAEQMVAQNFNAIGKVRKELETYNQQLLGPEGQVARLGRARKQAQEWVSNAEAWARYGMHPEEVSQLQDRLQNGNESERADASRQLKEAQEKAMNPGDPARLWHDMDSYHQAEFLVGNGLSQLGMALMHVNGQTPMDQLNHLMDLDYQKQKDTYGRRQSNLKGAYDAFSYVQDQTKDLVEQEALAKSMMMAPLEMRLQATGQADAAQKISDARYEKQNSLVMRRYEAERQTDMDLVSAYHAKLLMSMSGVTKPKPVPERDKMDVEGNIEAAGKMLKMAGKMHEGFLTGMFSAGSDRAEFNRTLDQEAADIARLTGKGANQQEIKGLRELMTPSTFGAPELPFDMQKKLGLTSTVEAAQQRMINKVQEYIATARQRFDQLRAAPEYEQRELDAMEKKLLALESMFQAEESGVQALPSSKSKRPQTLPGQTQD